MLHPLRGLALLSLLFVAPLAACGGSSDATSSSDENDLTSNSASERTLTFQGMFYVPTGTSDQTVAQLAQTQAKAAFGALRTSNMMVKSKYMTGIVPGSIKRLPVNVLDTSKPKGTKGTVAVRVTYQYKDVLLVPKTRASEVFTTALLNPAYDSMQSVVRKNCTGAESTEGSEPIWYSFDTSSAACMKDVTDEDAKIQTDRGNLPAPAGFKYPWITLTEKNRVFFPTTMSIGPDTTNQKVSYPEYDQLYAGHGVEEGKLVVGIVGGYATHKAVASEKPLQGKYKDPQGQLTNDAFVFEEFMWASLIALSARPTFTMKSPLDLHFQVNGHDYTFASYSDLAVFSYSDQGTQPRTNAAPADVTADHDALEQAIMDRLSKTWLTWEAPVTVTQGAAAHPLTLKLQAYFGTDEENTDVFKQAIKSSDVLGYMGHSYTGHGPYAPGKIVAADFPKSYQLMFWNGCVSYNYYDASFMALKPGGSKALDIVANAIEGQFSEQEGTFAAAIFDGSLPSYSELLTRLQAPEKSFGTGNDTAYDPFRVVDGELDNVYVKGAPAITLQ